MAPRALVLVRNAVTHDARVMRAADTLRGAGYAVLVAGVVSGTEPAAQARLGPVAVVRLDPRHRRGRSRSPSRPADPGAIGQPPSADPQRPSRSGSVRPVARIRRLAVTTSYYGHGLALAARTRPALVHANDYNTMWIALGAKLICGSRVVYDSHELWADRNGRSEWRPWLIAWEALFVRLADVTITASPGYAEALSQRYRVPPPTVIRNIAERRGADPVQDRNDQDDARPLAVYAGGLMAGRGLEVAIRALAHVPELRLRLLGPGSPSYRASLEAVARSEGVADRVTIDPPVAPDTLVAALAGARFGVLLIEPVCRSYELTLPNKLFEYAAAGLPMLASDLPVIGPLVRHHNLGEVVDPGDVSAIAAAMRRLIDPQRPATAAGVAAFAEANGWPGERAVLAELYRSTGQPQGSSRAARWAARLRA